MLGKKAGPKDAGKSQGEQIDELMEYIEGGGSLGLEIEKRLDELPEKYVVLLVTNQEKYDLLIANLVKAYTKKGASGIFVTINRSGESLVKMLGENKVDCSKLFIIDVISKGEKKTENISFVDSPQDLTELQAEASDIAEKIPPGNRFFILDSLSTMLIYNAEKNVEKFVHRFGERLRSQGFQTVFIIMEKTKPEVMNVLSQFCDKVIKPSPKINP